MTTTSFESHIKSPEKTPLRQHAWRLLRGSIYLILEAYAIGVLVFSLFVLIDRTNMAVVEILKTGFWVGLWTVIPVLLLTLILHFWRISALLTLPTLMLGAYYVPILLPDSIAPPATDARKVIVMTYNLLAGADKADVMDETVQIMIDSDADIIAMQELTRRAIEVFEVSEDLLALYPYHYFHPEQGNPRNAASGQGIFSKYPIVEDNFWIYDEDIIPILVIAPGYVRRVSHGHQRSVIDVNGQLIVIYNTHPFPPFQWLGGITFEYFDEEDYSHRTSIQDMVERAHSETLPTVLLGDFNMSEQFTEYGWVTDHFTDSFRESGQGMGFTYPAGGFGLLPELIRLDYIFHNHALRSIDTRVLDSDSPSDHLPVIATLLVE